jgi:hypothetical protein
MDDARNTGAAPATRRGALFVGVGVAAALAGAGYAWMRSRQSGPVATPASGTGTAPGTDHAAADADQAGAQQFWAQEYETPQGT